MKNTLKILYILIIGIGVFFVNNIWVLLGVIGFHLFLYFFLKNKEKSLSFLWKIKWFVLIIIVFHAFPGDADIELFKIKNWVVGLNYTGLLKGAVMSGKLIAMLCTTQVVRLSMQKRDFIEGMQSLGLGYSTAEIINEILDVVQSEKPKSKKHGGGKGNGQKEKSSVKAIDVLFKGKVGNLPQKITDKLNFAAGHFENNPNANIASSALAITLIRMVKIAPGLPLAPGHKNILVFPILIHGLMKSDKPFAGTQIGAITGVLHFLMGFGNKYGPLGILEFVILGFLMDLLFKLPFKKDGLFFLMLVGGLGGATRISIEIILAQLFDMPKEFFILYLPYIISQISFGIASGFLSRALLAKNK